MSLIVAAHNQQHIVIGTESLNTITRDGKPFVPDKNEVQKVVEVNPRLALMITGTYMSDKLPFIRAYKRAVGDITDLDMAFRTLFDMGQKSMTIHPTEGFMIGLAGYGSTGPSFRLITQAYGDGMGYVEDYPFTHYLSGEKAAVQHAESLLKSSSIDAQSPTEEIEKKIREILEACITAHPEKLGGPVGITLLPTA